MNLLEYIKDYVRDVKCIDSYFRDKYCTSNVIRSVRLKKIPKEGILDKGKYYFHGVGCRVIYPSKVVNFDYSPQCLVGGFKLYDIIDYLESKERKVLKEDLEKELKELQIKGHIIKVASSSFFYLKSMNDA